jgi:glycosyltransferase A (GT-A) superfamily protein (DUF2064 family)
MSRSDTGRHQLGRLTAAGLRVAIMPELTDVDTVREAELVAGAIPGSRFAAAYAFAMEGLTPAGRRQATGPWTVTSVP